jgi:hypothetical protein
MARALISDCHAFFALSALKRTCPNLLFPSRTIEGCGNMSHKKTLGGRWGKKVKSDDSKKAILVDLHVLWLFRQQVFRAKRCLEQKGV